MAIGEKINALMEKKGLSQNRLAKAAQISQSGLSSIINGKSSPKEDTLKAIAKVLECPAWELMKEFEVPEELAASDEEIKGKYNTPQTQEAKVISGAVDMMPKEIREQAETIMRTMYKQYFIAFEGKEKTS